MDNFYKSGAFLQSPPLHPTKPDVQIDSEITEILGHQKSPKHIMLNYIDSS